MRKQKQRVKVLGWYRYRPIKPSPIMFDEDDDDEQFILCLGGGPTKERPSSSSNNK